MKLYGFKKLYFLLFFVVAFLVAGIATASFAVTLGCRGFTRDVSNGLDYAHSVAVSPDGKNLYAVGNADHRLVVFDRDTDTGDLTFIEEHIDDQSDVDGLFGAIFVIVSPDGENVYVAGNGEAAIARFNRNANGTLEYADVKKNGVGVVDGLLKIWSIAFSPEGDYLYSISAENNALTTFSRAPGGTLTFKSTIKDGDNSDNGTVDGLLGGTSLAISPDGKHLYTAGFSDDSVARFNLLPDPENPVFSEVYILTIVPDDDYFGPHSVVVSPDGKHLYVAGHDEDAIGMFNRTETGHLINFEMKRNGDEVSPGVYINGLTTAFLVDVSPDGKHVYVIGHEDHAVTMFKRDENDGQLTFLGMQQDEFNCNGLGSATSLVVSPDNKNLYATGAGDDAVAIFSILYTPTELDAERSRWDANDDNKIGLEEAIQALRITSGL